MGDVFLRGLAGESDLSNIFSFSCFAYLFSKKSKVQLTKWPHNRNKTLISREARRKRWGMPVESFRDRVPCVSLMHLLQTAFLTAVNSLLSIVPDSCFPSKRDRDVSAPLHPKFISQVWHWVYTINVYTEIFPMNGKKWRPFCKSSLFVHWCHYMSVF